MRVWQGWIRVNLRREVASKAVDLESLLEGKASAFVHVHSAAMLSLVADQATIKADVCPETLLFDVHRLSMLQRELRYVVAATTMLVTATHHLTATRNGTDLEVRTAPLLLTLSCSPLLLSLFSIPSSGLNGPGHSSPSPLATLCPYSCLQVSAPFFCFLV